MAVTQRELHPQVRRGFDLIIAKDQATDDAAAWQFIRPYFLDEVEPDDTLPPVAGSAWWILNPVMTDNMFAYLDSLFPDKQ